MDLDAICKLLDGGVSVAFQVGQPRMRTDDSLQQLLVEIAV
jgi:hypothetical protein